MERQDSPLKAQHHRFVARERPKRGRGCAIAGEHVNLIAVAGRRESDGAQKLVSSCRLRDDVLKGCERLIALKEAEGGGSWWEGDVGKYKYIVGKRIELCLRRKGAIYI